MKTPDLVCIGHVISEMIYFPNAVKGPFLGSPPAYCSVAASRQNTKTGLSTKIGSDMPQGLLQPLIQAGVDVTGIQTTDRTTTTELIYNEHGHKEIRYPTKASPITVEDIPKSYHGCRLIYVCPMDNDVLPEDLADIVALGEVSAVDLGGYGGVHMSVANREATALSMTSPAALPSTSISSKPPMKMPRPSSDGMIRTRRHSGCWIAGQMSLSLRSVQRERLSSHGRTDGRYRRCREM